MSVVGTPASLSVKFWHWLLRRADRSPWVVGLAIMLAMTLSSLLLGWGMSSLEESVVKWLDNAFIVLGGLSLLFGWAFWLVLRARQQEAALTFRRAGDAVKAPAFRAALILVSQPVVLEWHLRQMSHERVELVWTEQSRAAAALLRTKFREIGCLHGPTCDAEDALSDVYDLNTIKAHCRALLTELLARFPPDQICVDVTGGTAVMSVGAFQVAEELGVTSIYLVGEHRDDKGRAVIRQEFVHDRAEGRIVILSDHRAPDADAAVADTVAPRSA